MLKKIGILLVSLFVLSTPVWAEEAEKVEAESPPTDPISAILLASFQIIGAIFDPGNYEYDPDDYDYWRGYYGRYDYDPWYGWYSDPWYSRYKFGYYGYDRYPYRYYGFPRRYCR